MTDTAAIQPRLLTIEDIADRLRVSRRRVRGIIRRAAVAFPDVSFYRRTGRSMRFTDADARRLLLFITGSDPRPLERTTNIYFIRGGDLVKIGSAVDVQARLKALQTGSPVRLELIGALSAFAGEEYEFHAELAKFRVHGEWFKATEPVLGYIDHLLDTRI